MTQTSSIPDFNNTLDATETALDVADKLADESNVRYSHEELFTKLHEVGHD